MCQTVSCWGHFFMFSIACFHHAWVVFACLGLALCLHIPTPRSKKGGLFVSSTFVHAILLDAVQLVVARSYLLWTTHCSLHVLSCGGWGRACIPLCDIPLYATTQCLITWCLLCGLPKQLRGQGSWRPGGRQQGWPGRGRPTGRRLSEGPWPLLLAGEKHPFL